ncbi:hypothetical protein TELCIR_04050 [Teladorsagia circumcincta]|uniref:Uncharacterized protein n=1 Tax=Teladorsagia circumcincta TaxID=45464 RepID=A0A2G9T4P8_TELCI|nr:hypothetical protein TELCIR_04050 [Teladorsagia circumcincta]
MILASVKRNSGDRTCSVERYWHCSRVAIDNDLELDHGVLFDHAKSFLSLVSRRAPYHVDKLSFGLSSKNVSHIHYCKFWTSLLQPRTVSVYSLAGGVSMQLGDYYWLFTLQVDRVSVVNCLNLGSYVLSEVIREWYCGKQKFLPNIDITFFKNGRTRIPFHIEDLVKRVKYKVGTSIH